MSRYLKIAFCTAFLLPSLLSLNGCDGLKLNPPSSTVGGTEKTPKPLLRVLLVNQPLTYSLVAGIESGYEFDLIQYFAFESQYNLQTKVVSSRKEMLRLLKQGKADLAAARLTHPEALQAGESVGPAYDEDRLSLVCHRETPIELNLLGSLNQRNQFRLGINSLEANSQWLSELRRQAPQIQISKTTARKTSQFFKKIQNRQLDCTIVDRLEAQYHLRFFKSLKVVKDISSSRTYHFVFSRQHPDLEKQLRSWFTQAARKKILSHTKAQYQEKGSELSPLAIQKFLRDQENLYPHYAEAIQKHSQEFRVPWQWVAAVAYQESQWNSDAVSFTGVKGLMQLTRETAEHLGVEDRTDASQSIWGGSKYLRMLLDRQPKGLPARERLALALATYNVGPAHMIDAQNLAQRLGKNPSSWRDMKLILPLLENKDYLEYLKYGPARGHEPVEFVHRVFAYLDLMSNKI